jgi:hypothetical protein
VVADAVEVEVGVDGENHVDVGPLPRPRRHRFHDHEVLGRGDAKPQPGDVDERCALHGLAFERQRAEGDVHADSTLVVAKQKHAPT